jgi:hypothetical protein
MRSMNSEIVNFIGIIPTLSGDRRAIAEGFVGGWLRRDEFEDARHDGIFSGLVVRIDDVQQVVDGAALRAYAGEVVKDVAL